MGRSRVGADWGVTDPILSDRDQANPSPRRPFAPASAAPYLARIEDRDDASSSPARPGSSARTTSATCSANSDDEVTVFDALTYAGNLDNLRDVDDDPALHASCTATSATAKRCSTARWTATTPSSTSRPRATSTARSSAPTSSSAPTASAPTCSATWPGASASSASCTSRPTRCTARSRTARSARPTRCGRARRTRRRRPAATSSPLAYHDTYGLPVVVTRSSNNFGPYQFPEKVIPLFVTNLLDGQTVPLYGDGLNVRDWCYVEDNCAAIDLVLRQGARRRDLQHRRRQRDHQPRAHRPAPRALRVATSHRCATSTDRLGHDRRYSIDTSEGARAGLDAEPRPRRRSRATRSSGTATTAGGGSR